MPGVEEGRGEADVHIGNLFETAVHAKDRLKAKTKALVSAPPEQLSSDEDVFSDAAFDPDKALNPDTPKEHRSAKQAIHDDLKSAAYVVAHPRRVMRSKATRTAAGTLGRRHPLLTAERDQELLDAHDDLAGAAEGYDSDIPGDDVVTQVDQAQDRLDKIQQQRESLQTAWILGRHLNRVKVVRQVSCPDKDDFRTRERFEWERYAGKLALYYTRGFTSSHIDDFDSPPCDLEDLARIVERIAITSAPLQSFCMNIRQIYTWKEPRRTAKWLATFLVLWYFQYIVAYIYFWIIYTTLQNRFREQSVQTVRESVSTAFDREARVQAWGDLIQRHGQNEWLEPFLNEIGPIIQLQLGDLADLMEIMVNFYRWERPKLTWSTLFFYACCLAVSLFADMAFCIKLVWFIAGGAFFVTYPLATNLPKYRIVLSHCRWMFWNIPTHAELAILSLQEKVAIREADLVDFDYRDSNRDDHDTKVGEQPKAPRDSYSFKAHEQSAGKGQLQINRTNLTFTGKTTPAKTYSFTPLDEIRKLDDIDVNSSSAIKNLKNIQSRSAGVLQFLWHDGSKELTLLMHPADRDRVFNLVLAWSGLKWKCLQMERHNTMDSERSNLDRAVKRAFH